ncbi:hypothetical protein LOZ39_003002 [Ophidiomyces ophidiicola]|nr:hypothetical protein LOZ61_001813 [Ophidiomyces ophidiicola]KAI1929970.1 hypothetical protein LOZ60_001227 [Ophidiomyces ophidiicola]KAI2010739.1 hypothetical protein LOZ49_003370 [Ophidiomyces ophidiicola]KAI2076105.1 hypothetical protein LOZ39_003002 [Ophidiomyces ophidiicola]KAI2145863.1 hypothetical protein LOZ29_000289 [Ophidiomyces ophidiicola]
METSSFQEPCTLDYARFHGITHNHLASDPLTLIPPAANRDSVACTPLTLDTLQARRLFNQKEKLSVDKRGAAFLTSITRFGVPHSLGVDACDPESSDRLRISNIAIDLPLLLTDHEHDMYMFRDISSLDSTEISLSLEQIDDENDEGFTFPRYVWDLPSQIHDQVAMEKLNCTKEAILFMQQIWTTHDPTPGHIKANMCEPITPPLPPRTPPSVPFIPSSPNMEMRLLSEPPTPDIPEHGLIENALIEDSRMLSEMMPSNTATSGFFQDAFRKLVEPVEEQFISNRNFALPIKRSLVLSIKVDGPLTPPVSAKKRRVTEEQKSLEETLAAASLKIEPSSDPDIPPKFNVLLEVSSLAQSQVESKLISERIRGIPAETRVQVPVLADPFPDSLWPSTTSILQLECSRRAESIENDDTINITRSSLTIEKEEWDLRWNPFPAGISPLQVMEIIDEEDGTNMPFILARSPSKLCIQKPKVADDFRESLHEPNVLLKETTPFSGAIGPVTDGPNSNESDNTSNVHSSWSRKAQILNDQSYPSLPMPKSDLLASQFSARIHLSNFMNVRQKAIPKGVVQTNFPGNNKTADVLCSSRENSLGKTCAAFDCPILKPPNLIEPSFPLTLMISNSVLRAYQSMIRALESHPIPKTLLFRDFDLLAIASERAILEIEFGSNSPSIGHKPFRQPTKAGNSKCGDADIIVSPTAAIILTSSQEVTQRYLPGHSSAGVGVGSRLRSPLQERIYFTCSRYEYLYVLICHPFSSNGIDTSICDNTLTAVRTLTSFCSSISKTCAVVPLIVSAAADHAAVWILNLAKKHAVLMPWDEPLLGGKGVVNTQWAPTPPEDPSLWELFLYHAGLNCFAAQMVLYSRVLPSCAHSEENDTNRAPAALSAFVELTSSERRRMYKHILGDRLIERVNSCLNSVW